MVGSGHIVPLREVAEQLLARNGMRRSSWPTAAQRAIPSFSITFSRLSRGTLSRWLVAALLVHGPRLIARAMHAIANAMEKHWPLLLDALRVLRNSINSIKVDVAYRARTALASYILSRAESVLAVHALRLSKIGVSLCNISIARTYLWYSS